MPSTLKITSVHLRVPDLSRSLAFYSGQLGFAVREQHVHGAQLAATPDTPPLLSLEEDRQAPAAPRDAAGLFHAALLFPDVRALGGWLRLAASRGVEFDGFSDHGVSEALYFSDPDGNGLEFYVDRARADWPRQETGELAMATRPLALRRLLSDAVTLDGPPLAGTRWGHLHLRVTDLARSESFYRAELGLEVMQRSFPGARFLAADGYHHHLGLNVWGHPHAPQPPHALGLARATFARAGEAAAREQRDPDGIALRIEPLEVAAPAAQP